MKYEILDSEGKTIKGIIAEPAFVERYYSGRYRLVSGDGPQSQPKELAFKRIITGLSAVRRKMLWAAKASNADVEDFLELVALNGSGRVTDQWVIDGIAACVTVGVLTSAQADNLLGD